MILSFDIGTTRVKGALYSRDGKKLAGAQARLPPGESPDPRIHEISPESWIDAVSACSREILSRGEKPECLVVSGNGPTLLPVGGDGKPLHPAISWMDRRSLEESELLKGMLGRYNNTAFYLPKAFWFYRKLRDIYESAKYFLSCPEYIEYFLTGEARTYLTATGYEDLIWTEPRLKELGMESRKFPPYAKPGSPVGRVRKVAAELTGIPEGTKVIAGVPDFIAAILGTAATRPGRVCDRAGSSEGINLCAEKGTEDERLIDMPHLVEPYRNISGVVSASGKAVDWLLEAEEREGAYEEFFKEIEGLKPGAEGLLFLPYLAGERAPIWDPRARGAFIGLGLGHGRGEMGRALVEGTVFAIRDIIEVMESVGNPVLELRVAGAMGRNAVLNRIKSDILALPVLVPEESEAELLGDACIALVSLGEFPSFGEAAENLVRFSRKFEPNPDLSPLYNELFKAFREGYLGLKQVFHDLDGIQAYNAETDLRRAP